jgi:hypothetical protein
MKTIDELRDFMAATALPAVMAKWPSTNAYGAAEIAYTYADAMLLVRDIDPEEYGTEAYNEAHD